MRLSLLQQLFMAGTGAQPAGGGSRLQDQHRERPDGGTEWLCPPVSRPRESALARDDHRRTENFGKNESEERRTQGIRESLRQSRLNMRKKQDHDPCHPAPTPEQHAERANGISQRHFMSISVTFLSQGTAPAGIARRYLLPSRKGCAYLDPRTRAPLTPHRMG